MTMGHGSAISKCAQLSGSEVDAGGAGNLPCAENQPQPESAKHKGRILVVDDESAIADTLALIFVAQRYEVKVAYSAEEAIETIAEWRPDVAILDVVLPGMNGIDLAIAIQANYSACQVLLFSGNTNTTGLLEEAGKKGHQFNVLPKPLHPTLMLEKVSDLLSSGPKWPTLD